MGRRRYAYYPQVSRQQYVMKIVVVLFELRGRIVDSCRPERYFGASASSKRLKEVDWIVSASCAERLCCREPTLGGFESSRSGWD
jgi:hypothetical protein